MEEKKESETKTKFSGEFSRESKNFELSAKGQYEVETDKGELQANFGHKGSLGADIRLKRDKNFSGSLGPYIPATIRKVANKYVNYYAASLGALVSFDIFVNMYSSQSNNWEYAATWAIISGLITAGGIKLIARYFGRKINQGLDALRIRF